MVNFLLLVFNIHFDFFFIFFAVRASENQARAEIKFYDLNPAISIVDELHQTVRFYKLQYDGIL